MAGMHRFVAVVKVETETVSLLQAMRRAWPLLPEHAFRAALKKRDILVNGQRVGGNVPVKPGDEIVLYTSQALRDIPVVYEDEHFLLVNKPAGVNSDKNAGSQFSLIAWAENRAAGAYQPELCHRLDNQTSGLILLAKDEASAAAARQVFKARNITKTYQCLAAGTPVPEEATLKAHLLKDAGKARVYILDKAGINTREIITRYKVLEPGKIARLEVDLVTGRTHQIRAHLAHIGHPILGDDLYGNRRLNRQSGQPGLKLCAVALAFPIDCGLESLRGKRFEVIAPF